MREMWEKKTTAHRGIRFPQGWNGSTSSAGTVAVGEWAFGTSSQRRVSANLLAAAHRHRRNPRHKFCVAFVVNERSMKKFLNFLITWRSRRVQNIVHCTCDRCLAHVRTRERLASRNSRRRYLLRSSSRWQSPRPRWRNALSPRRSRATSKTATTTATR